MNKTLLYLLSLLLGGMVLGSSLAFLTSINNQKLLTAALYNPPSCPFHIGLTPYSINNDKDFEEAVLLKAFFNYAVIDKNNTPICNESDNLNTCLARFQNFCYSQGKCDEKYDPSKGAATITPQIQSYLCTLWTQRHTKLFDSWAKVTSLFKLKNIPLPNWLTTSCTNYLTWENQQNTTTTKSTTTTKPSNSSNVNFQVDIDSWRPKAKESPVLSVSPDIDISQIVPPGYNYAPRIESWIYYLDRNNLNTISRNAPPQISYRILNTNSSRRYKVERIDTDGKFTDITNSPDTKWEISMPFVFSSDQSCFHFAPQTKFTKGINKLQEEISQKYNIPLSSYLVPIQFSNFEKIDSSYVKSGYHVGLCQYLNPFPNENYFIDESTYANDWIPCFLSYYNKDGNKWSIDVLSIEKYKNDMLNRYLNFNGGSGINEPRLKALIDSIGIQEGFCMDSLNEDQKRILNSITETGLIKISDDFVVPTQFDTNEYLKITDNGVIQSKNKEGIFFITITDKSKKATRGIFDTLVDRFKKMFNIGSNDPSLNVTFPIIVLDFNKYNKIINETLTNINNLTPYAGASKYIKTYYTNIPGLYGLDYNPAYNPISFGGGCWISSVLLRGNNIKRPNSKFDCVYDDLQQAINIYSLIPDPIFFSKDSAFDLLSKSKNWFSVKGYTPFISSPPLQNYLDDPDSIELPDYYKRTGNFYPRDPVYQKLKKTLLLLPSAFYDNYSQIQVWTFPLELRNSALNLITPLIPCQHLNKNEVSNDFHVGAQSLNNPNWRDSISFKVFDCTNTSSISNTNGNTSTINNNTTINNSTSTSLNTTGCKDNASRVQCIYYTCHASCQQNPPRPSCIPNYDFVCPEEKSTCEAKSQCDPNDKKSCSLQTCTWCVYDYKGSKGEKCRKATYYTVNNKYNSSCKIDYRVGGLFDSKYTNADKKDNCCTSECGICIEQNKPSGE